MPKNRSTLFKARGAQERSGLRAAAAPENLDILQAPAPIRRGTTTTVDSETLKELAQQLRTVSDGLLATQEDLYDARQESKAAKSDAEEAINLNRALQNQLDQQKHHITFPAFDWRVKGNQVQWELNYTLIADLTRTLTLLEEKNNDGALNDVSDGIKSTISALLFRNKLIKIADTSKDGWLVVKEYIGSNFMEDDEDQKQLRRAEASAATKVKRLTETSKVVPAVRGGRGGYRGRGGYPQNQGYYSGQQAPSYQPYQYQQYNQYQQYQPQQQYQQYQGAPQQPSAAQGSYANPNQQAQAPRPRGGCFLCGGPHYARDCPGAKHQVAGVQGQIEAQYNKN
jgi:hypothetical protein